MKAKKSLGQNFFVNKNLCTQIINTVLDEDPQVIVEIGPGLGTFTEYLAQSSASLVLVEKDDDLAKDLEKTFQDSKVCNIDFLDWDFSELERYKGKSILFFGSLPYNVSKPIIKKIVSSEYFNSKAFFIVQREVAEKYIERVPNSNMLSLETEIYGDAKRLLNISPDSFRPKPKVNSSLISINPNRKHIDINTRSFEKFIKICFTQPRKTLRNNLKNFKIADDNKVEILLQKRPQHLSLDEYVFLFGMCEIF